VTDFLRRKIRYLIFIGVCLFGITYELAKSETIRWPLIVGYLAVLGASIYGIRKRAEEENAPD
jgi:hypothetical protein